MEKKYKLLTDDKIVHKGKTLYRIQALKDFSKIYKNDLGGYIEGEQNLSHKENCWVYGNAKVYGYARICDNAEVYDNVEIYGSAKVYDYAKIYDNAKIFNLAEVFNTSMIGGCAQIYDYAKIYGYTKVGQYAKVAEYMHIKYSSTNKDLLLKENLGDNIRCQTNLPVFSDEKGDYVIGFKHVNVTQYSNIFKSGHNPSFIYKLNEWAEVENPDMSNNSCASGLHFSNLTYWENSGLPVVIQVKCYLNDIITVQQGKIRCKKLLPLAVVKNGTEFESNLDIIL